MPYTKEQLENNEYFQSLKLEASREYEEERARAIAESSDIIPFSYLINFLYLLLWKITINY